MGNLYSFSRKSWFSGKWPYLKGNYYWRDPFLTPFFSHVLRVPCYKRPVGWWCWWWLSRSEGFPFPKRDAWGELYGNPIRSFSETLVETRWTSVEFSKSPIFFKRHPEEIHLASWIRTCAWWTQCLWFHEVSRSLGTASLTVMHALSIQFPHKLSSGRLPSGQNNMAPAVLKCRLEINQINHFFWGTVRDVLSNHCTYCSDTPLRINILNPTMEVWFRCFFSNWGILRWYTPCKWNKLPTSLVSWISKPSTVSLSQRWSVYIYMDNASSLLFILLIHICISYILLSMLAICRDCHPFLHRSIMTVQE